MVRLARQGWMLQLRKQRRNWRSAAPHACSKDEIDAAAERACGREHGSSNAFGGAHRHIALCEKIAEVGHSLKLPMNNGWRRDGLEHQNVQVRIGLRQTTVVRVGDRYSIPV